MTGAGMLYVSGETKVSLLLPPETEST